MYVFFFFVFFFFKQKTAYEMRISDWSSDVCSSDGEKGPRERNYVGRISARFAASDELDFLLKLERGRNKFENASGGMPGRSEEHTSELQSLMRISYAVFCLKKQNTTQKITHK